MGPNGLIGGEGTVNVSCKLLLNEWFDEEFYLESFQIKLTCVLIVYLFEDIIFDLI